jgi:hypothetical protein
MDLSKFIWLLSEKKLFLSRLDMLGDPYEGSHTIKTIEMLKAFFREHKLKDGWPDLSQWYRHVRAETYVSCWHEGEHESEAMWRLYSPNKNGVAIQTTYGELVRSIESQHDVYIGRIRYVDYSKDWFPDANIYRPVMHKRIAFSHEREIRMVRHFSGNGGNSQGTSVPWDAETWVRAIYIDPYAPEYFFEAVNAVINLMIPSIHSRVTWSKMRELPSF